MDWRRATAPRIVVELAFDGHPGGTLWEVPILQRRVVEAVLERARDPGFDRRPLLELAFSKLQSPLRKSLHQSWGSFLGQMELSDAERREHRRRFEDLLHAPAAPAVRLGLAEAKRILGNPGAADGAWVQNLAGRLAIALEHPVQGVAVEAWRLLRNILDRQPDLTAELAPAVVRTLSISPPRLRRDLVRWLQRQDPATLGSEGLRRIASTAADLDFESRAALAPLLPDGPADSGPSSPALAPPPEDTSPPPAGAEELRALIQAAEARAEDLRAVDRRRLAALRAFLDGEADAHRRAEARGPADFSTAPPWPSFADAESMARALLVASDHPFSLAELERFLEGICRFPIDHGDAEGRSLTQLLDPLLRQRDEPSANRPWVAGWISHVWLGTEAPEEPASYLWFRRLQGIARRRKDGATELPLAIPTHANGWLDPKVFVARFADLEPRHRDLEELELAFYRLMSDPARREEAWRWLEDRGDDGAPILEASPNPISDALRVALAPDEPAKAITVRWAAAGRAVGSDTPPRPADRLLDAALRGRHGLGDVAPWLGEDADPWSKSRVSVEPDWRHADPRAVRELQGFFRERFLHPRPFEDDSVFEPVGAVSKFQVDQHPHLVPYMTTRARLGTGSWIRATCLDFPPAAQRFFEAGLQKLDDAIGSKGSKFGPGFSALRLLEAGGEPQVDVAPLLGRFAPVLTTRFAENREQAVTLLLGWLDDGRVTPDQLADTLSDLMASTSRGAKHIDEGLASLSTAGPGPALVVQMALERLLTGGSKPKPLWLERLSRVVVETGRAAEDAAKQRLETLAQRKSSVGEHARAVLRAGGAPPTVPSAVASLGALLSEGVATAAEKWGP
ncbi:MAG: hypothetical protein AAGN66_19955 [Acidobacteriota bacterium]